VILELDAGNTRIKWRVRAPSNEIIQDGSCQLDEVAELCANLIDQALVRRICVSSVLCDEKLAKSLQGCVERLGEKNIVFAKTVAACGGLTIAYVDPSRLGVDRFLAMLAAFHHYGGCILVIDAGSALTGDIVDESGSHLGGYIMNGLHVMRQVIVDRTDSILVKEDAEFALTPGRTTEACVSHGALLMFRGAVKQLVAQASAVGVKRVIVTGGDAAAVLSCLSDCDLEIVLAPALVLDGLALWAESCA
jgi:type III pantothenate kinase